MRKLKMKLLNKKGFTLMEVVIALAVVGLICALILPLTASAMNSFNAAQSMRDVASTASKEMGTAKHKLKGSEKIQEVLYATIKFDTIGINVESELKFSKTEASNSAYEIKVTYYDLEQNNVNDGK